MSKTLGLGVHNNQTDKHVLLHLENFLNIENKSPFDSATLLVFNKHLV